MAPRSLSVADAQRLVRGQVRLFVLPRASCAARASLSLDDGLADAEETMEHAMASESTRRLCEKAPVRVTGALFTESNLACEVSQEALVSQSSTPS